jgi:UDP-N-acetylglucosamine--N-acetylmuramyl-(pentapeptide) pyrophosphoryl-undecaprenol N-acetylglucosamine transferase
VAGNEEALRKGGIRGGGLLILVTLGTHEQPFERVLDMVEPLAAEDELIVQHGHTPPRQGRPGMRWLDFVDYDELEMLTKSASAVICHAGVGSIMTALAAGKTPVVIPRRRAFGEHVDDHQRQIAQELDAQGLVVACLEAQDLPSALVTARSRKRRLHSRGRLHEAVARAVDGE